jgi:hypothetical protein
MSSSHETNVEEDRLQRCKQASCEWPHSIAKKDEKNPKHL